VVSDDIFLPKEVECARMDDFEREIEEFKRSVTYRKIQYDKKFLTCQEICWCSSKTEMPTTTHRWLVKSLGKQVSFESTFKNVVRETGFVYY